MDLNLYNLNFLLFIPALKQVNKGFSLMQQKIINEIVPKIGSKKIKIIIAKIRSIKYFILIYIGSIPYCSKYFCIIHKLM